LKLRNNMMKSTLSHGGGSDRVYLMHLHPEDFPAIIPYIEDLADKFQYTKYFAKVPSRFAPAFINAGYIVEAAIPRFFDGEDDVLFLAKYKTAERHVPEHDALQAFQDLLIQPATNMSAELDGGLCIRKLTETDINAMIEVFKCVFETYPFPIFEPAFLLKSMREDGTLYFGVFQDERLIAVSSAECNAEEKNAEMTDFAVLPEFRGKRLAIHLLSFMENALANEDFKTFYTISRLKSLSMNKTFYNSGYKYSGTLIQNTQISGNIESMNIWYKNVAE